MPDYQWKLTIIERNLLLANWTTLLPEAQERMVDEVEELIADLPLSDRHRLLSSLETLQEYGTQELQQKMQLLLSSQSSPDLRNVLEFNLKDTTLSVV